MKIETKERVYAELIQPCFIDSDKPKTYWFGKETEPLQVNLMCYADGNVFRTHRHIMNPRIINRTQEVFVVISGELTVDIYESLNKLGQVEKHIPVEAGKDYIHLGTLNAKKGEAIVILAGFHRINLKGIAYECKAGAFNGIVSEDKEFLNV